ncbi:MAG: DUF1648 domain-containing protein [Candidatus Shapirobacteria bacterium]|nr:DUF1648 domain-containing protein [Candidatus Shapirobacteria bacterium]
MKFHHLFPLAIIFITVLIGITLYPYLPDILATHWGISGEVNGYSSKAFALFFMPGMSLALYFIFLFLPKIDPYQKNFAEFDQYYYLFVNIIFAFLFYIQLLTIFWDLGSRFNMIQAMSPALAILYYYAGVLLKNTHRNWFVGIRTPWTMTSDVVWKKTHEVSSSLFQIAGLLALMALFVPQLSLYLVLVPVLFNSIFIFVYSYYLYRRL